MTATKAESVPRHICGLDSTEVHESINDGVGDGVARSEWGQVSGCLPASLT